MMIEKKIQLPANCVVMNETEQMETVGGSAAETAVKAVIAVGVSGALACAAGAAAYAVLQVFNPKVWDNFLEGTMTWGKNFIDGSMAAGENFLHKLMGISPLN